MEDLYQGGPPLSNVGACVGTRPGMPLAQSPCPLPGVLVTTFLLLSMVVGEQVSTFTLGQKNTPLRFTCVTLFQK
jgi:hypothetical protein